MEEDTAHTLSDSLLHTHTHTHLFINTVAAVPKTSTVLSTLTFQISLLNGLKWGRSCCERIWIKYGSSAVHGGDAQGVVYSIYCLEHQN